MPLSKPASHLMIDDLEVELFRCDADGGIVIKAKGYDSAPAFSAHSGHHLNQPVILTEQEIEDIIDELKLTR
jgi:hypothetical protein